MRELLTKWHFSIMKSGEYGEGKSLPIEKE